MYKCNISYRYGFILRWNPRIYNMCRQALAHEQENFNNFPCSGIFGDFRGFRTWDDMTQRMQIKCIWGDPTNKNSMAYAENAVKQIELGMKYIMAENSLPVEWWQAACVQAAELRNIVSMMKNASKSHSGDAVRPAPPLYSTAPHWHTSSKL